jgi:hypothetical protein
MLTIAYITCRKNPNFDWFMDSLTTQLNRDGRGVRLVVVDRWANHRHKDRLRRIKIPKIGFDTVWHGTPKSSVWQGDHRLTSKDYFAAANARNTALCLAPDGYLACVDDNSVLTPTWLEEVRAAQKGNYIALGAYMKVHDMSVLDGRLVHYDESRVGMDSRYHLVEGMEPTPCKGQWMFGCSFAAPVESLLYVNGFDEDCDSHGTEDYILGTMLETAGNDLRYCKRMMTVESEEGHDEGDNLVRSHKRNVHGHPDAHFAILHMVKNGRNRAPNYQDMRATRATVLAGGEFPLLQIPEHDWRDGQPLKDM